MRRWFSGKQIATYNPSLILNPPMRGTTLFRTKVLPNGEKQRRGSLGCYSNKNTFVEALFSARVNLSENSINIDDSPELSLQIY